jgi:hypothetical protein
MNEINETLTETEKPSDKEADDTRFNNLVGALVAVLATLMGLFNVKDGNIVQAMDQAQANKVNSWSYYQAKSTKQVVAEGTLEQLLFEEQRGMVDAEGKARLAAEISRHRERIAQYVTEKEQIKHQAEDYGREYDRLNFHDDQFDMADAGLNIAISLLGITALVRRKWLLGVALVFATGGIVMGMTGFFGWGLHPDVLARMLS